MLGLYSGQDGPPKEDEMGFKTTGGSAIVLGLVILLCASAHAQTLPKIEPIAPVGFGELFPPSTFANLNASAGPVSIDLAGSIGKRPVVLYYWIAGNPRADQLFLEVEALVKQAGADKVHLFGVVFPQPGRGADVIGAQIKKLGLTTPVLDDKGFQLGGQLRVQSVPNITIIDSEGRLRLTNGASLRQVLEYKMDLSKAIQRVAASGSVGTYGYLSRYYPVNELVGKPTPDFKAPLVDTSVERSLSSLINDKAVNVLIFWSVDCSHCRKALPELNVWLKENSSGLNVITVAKAMNGPAKTKTKEFCDLNGFVFQTLIDKDLGVASLYQVTSTPTYLIITPDGVVDSVLLRSTKSVIRSIDEKRRQLLGTAQSS